MFQGDTVRPRIVMKRMTQMMRMLLLVLWGALDLSVGCWHLNCRSTKSRLKVKRGPSFMSWVLVHSNQGIITISGIVWLISGWFPPFLVFIETFSPWFIFWQCLSVCLVAHMNPVHLHCTSWATRPASFWFLTCLNTGFLYRNSLRCIDFGSG